MSTFFNNGNACKTSTIRETVEAESPREPLSEAARIATVASATEETAMQHKGRTVQLDPRHRNERFDTTSPGRYLAAYSDRLRKALDRIDEHALEQVILRISEAAAAGKRVYSIGNGGSAAIADHLCCDLTKGTDTPGHPVVDAVSLTSNVALYSAIANDFGFTSVFSRQLRMLGRQGDVLIAISSSGESANILEAVDEARKVGMTTIGLTGFTGGQLKEYVDLSIHVDVNNYGIVEDAHQLVMHVMAQYLVHAREECAEAIVV
jgi:D-sedoheptulose 7-phosphate isomerase